MNQSSTSKKVLVIAYFYPPLGGGGVQRTVKFVKYLRSFGYEPTILTVKKGKHSVADNSFDSEIPRDTRVIRTNFIGLFAPKKKASAKTQEAGAAVIPQKKSPLKKFLAKIFHLVEKFFFIPDIQMLWRPFAYPAALKLLRKEHFDVVYSTSSPFTDHLIGRDLHRITGIPWVADFRDHWTVSPTYKPATWVHRIIDRSYETSILKEASGIVFNTEINRQDIEKSFGFLPRKHAVIYNGFDPSDFKDIVFQKKDTIDAYYIGSLYGKEYSSKEIMAGLNIVFKQVPKLHVTFIGDIDSYSQEIIAASPYFQKNVFLKGYVPHSEITRYTQQAGLLLATTSCMPGSECWVPQKIYEYIGARRPVFVLASKNGETAKIIKTLRAGVSVDQAERPEIIADVLVDFLRQLAERDFKAETDLDAAKAFERKNLTKQLVDFFDEVVG